MNRLRCHRCRSDALLLSEVCEEYGTWDQIVVTQVGTLASLGAMEKEPGEVIRTRIRCEACGHEWVPRRSFEGHIGDPS